MRIDVWFVMLPGVLSLDMTGPAETFVLAGDAFCLHYIGPQPEVQTSIGLMMSGIAPLPERLPEGSLLVLPGVSDSRVQFSTPQAMQIQHWLMPAASYSASGYHRDVRLLRGFAGSKIRAAEQPAVHNAS